MVKPKIIAVIYINLGLFNFLTQIQNLGITDGSISIIYNKPNLLWKHPFWRWHLWQPETCRTLTKVWSYIFWFKYSCIYKL